MCLSISFYRLATIFFWKNYCQPYSLIILMLLKTSLSTELFSEESADHYSLKGWTTSESLLTPYKPAKTNRDGTIKELPNLEYR